MAITVAGHLMKVELVYNGKSLIADAQLVNDTVWIHFDGQTYAYESDSQKKMGRAKRAGPVGGNLLAPMPGKVTKLSKAVGATVRPGEVVLIMEAMKMEYTLKASLAGQVKSIHCQVGDLVPLGKLLVEIEPETTS